MKFVLRGRRRGKTTAAVDFVMQGLRRAQYPGWDRILIVPDEVQRLLVLKQFGPALAPEQVFAIDTWLHHARGRQPVVIAFDNIDMWIRRALGAHNDVAMVTWTQHDDA